MKTQTITLNGTQFTLPVRDTERGKVYAAEIDVFYYDNYGTPEERRVRRHLRDVAGTEAFIDKIVSSRLWLNLLLASGQGWRGPKPTIRFRKNARAHAKQSFVVLLGVFDGLIEDWVVLHELAHIAVGAKYRHHWPYRRAFLTLLAHFMDQKTADLVESRYEARGLKTPHFPVFADNP